MKTHPHCAECGAPISWGVYDFSQEVFGCPLCLKHQVFNTESCATPWAKNLYLALKSCRIPVVLEYFDGHKLVDIALPGKLYIEINGPDHYNSIQAMTDLTRSVYSLQENIPTISIPNYLLENPETFKLTVEQLTKACRTLLVKSSFWELAHTLTPVQLQ
jgi:hypothetical protein